MDWNDSSGWLLFGLLGNLVFSSRFLVQWIASERARASVVPPVFWHLSLVGSLVLLAYALHRRDPVFVLAYLPNGFVYVRNLVLIRRGSAGVPAPERPVRPEVGARALASRES